MFNVYTDRSEHQHYLISAFIVVTGQPLSERAHSDTLRKHAYAICSDSKECKNDNF